MYNGVREIVSLGEKSKLASSKRRRNAKRRRTTDATGGGGSSGTTSNSTSNSRRKRANRAGGDGNTNTHTNTAVGTEEQQHEDGPEDERDNLGGQQEQEVSMHGRGGGTPSRAEAGSSSGSGATDVAEANRAPHDDALPRGEEASATVMPSSVSIGGGDVNANDSFALLSPDKLATFDIVLTTFEVLRAEVHHAESRFANILGKGEAAEAGRPSLRRKKR